MKIGGVSEREGMDALFFAAVDKAVGTGNDFSSVLSQSKSKVGTTDFAGTIEGSKGTANCNVKEAAVNPSETSKGRQMSKDKDDTLVSERNAKVSEKNVPAEKGNEEKADTVKVNAETVKSEAGTASQETEISNETIEALSAAIVDVVSQLLNMEPQQVEDLLSETQINPLELFKPEKLMELLLATSETGDITELLTNEELAGRLSLMEDALEKFDLDRYGVTKEQLEALYSGQKAEAYKIPQETMEAAKTQETMEADDVISDGKAVKEERRIVNAHNVMKEAAKGDTAEQSEQKVVVTDFRERPETMENGKNADGSAGQGQSKQTGHLTENVHTESSEKTEVTEQFVNQLATNSVQSEYSEDVVRQTVVMYREIVDQIVEQIRVVIRPEQTSMNMQLMPENLGRVYVNMTAKNGVVTATFLVQNEIAKEAIEANLEVFKQNLNQQGTKVEAVEVDVADFAFEQKDTNGDAKSSEEQKESEGKPARRQLSFSELTAPAEELTDEEQAAVSRMLQNGSTVEYTA